MKKILLPISEREYLATDKRFFHFMQTLAADFKVELLTISKDVYDDINSRSDSIPNISVRFIEPRVLPLTLDFRTDLVKVFVRYTKDLSIPDTGLKLWKTAAFDDFWGHLATSSFTALSDIDADVVLTPLLTYDEAPFEGADVFYSSVLFRAKELGIKICGFQLYPVFQGIKLMPLLMDALIVRKEHERNFYIDNGIPSDRIHLVSDKKDIYSISTIDDAYKNNMFNSQIPIDENELAVVILNHSKFRPHIREIIKAAGNAKIPMVLFLVKRDYGVKDLVEDDIIKDFFFEDIGKLGCRFYLIESQSIVPVIMVSDVVISPAFVTPLEFAARYEKKPIVFNPFYDAVADIEGAVFINRSEALSLALVKTLEEKKKTKGIKDIMKTILRAQ
jgi:hypothetical protein